MSLPEICIKKPVFATVLNLFLLILGIVAFFRLSVREYPNIDAPVVSVETRYRGASAEIIESEVTQILEESLAGIEGIDVMSSHSRQEASQISINFNLERNPETAASDVRDRVSRVRGKLPRDIEEPIVQKVEADAQPIIYIAFYSDRHSPLEITDFADREVKSQLQTLPGVAEVMIFGERRYAMRLYVDPERLAAFHLSPQEIEAALRRQNIDVPSGRIEGKLREYTVLSETNLKTPEEFNNMVIAEHDGYLIKFQDVGYAKYGAAEERSVARYNGKDSIALGIVKQATANPLDVSKVIQEKLPLIQKTIPEGMKIDIAYNKANYIKSSIDNVYHAIFEAIILVGVIIFLFLGNLRITLIPLIAIPISMFGAFFLMMMMGFSINILSLLAFVLAIGLVVDDAIVVLENVHRYLEQGKKPFEAAMLGCKEISFAILAMTLTLAAVFAPVGFLTGVTGKLFTEFSWTLAGAVLISGFVALTLTPMMCSKLLRHNHSPSPLTSWFEKLYKHVQHGYEANLKKVLLNPKKTLALGMCLAIASFSMFWILRSELAPMEDEGTIIGVFMAPEGATIDYTSKYANQLEHIFDKVPEVEKFFVVSGFPVVNMGISFMKLVDWKEREREAKRIIFGMGGEMFNVTGLMAFPMNPPPLGQSPQNKALEVAIQTTESYEKLDKMSEALLMKLRQNPGLTYPETDLKLNKPQLKIEIDREKAAELNVEIETIGRTLETLLGGRQVTRFKRDGKQYDVIVQLANFDRSNQSDLQKIYVKSTKGEMIQLSNIIKPFETVSPKELNHFNQLRAASLSANLAPGYTIGEAVEYVEKSAKEVLNERAKIEFNGESREFQKSSSSIYFFFVLALVFIYLVLSAQFESFKDPLIILFTVPLSIGGALVTLYLAGKTLNIFSQVGMITLIGLITKHGILIVEFANQQKESGKKSFQAIYDACLMRLRPILMTSAATVLGAFPLAIAIGAGAESRQNIGWVIVGGLTIGTFFTLFVIPCVYLLFQPKEKEAEKTIKDIFVIEGSAGDGLGSVYQGSSHPDKRGGAIS
jgi:multidrug efflux pump